MYYVIFKRVVLLKSQGVNEARHSNPSAEQNE